MISIPFNRPNSTSLERQYIVEALDGGKLSGDGPFTKACHQYFEQHYGFRKTLLTTSCTDALEMAALLLNVMPGDEVIMPSYTFVSTANAFILRGAKIVFADSEKNNPNISYEQIAALITPFTKVIVVVHYAGVACDMDPILSLAAKYGIKVVEDAAQAIDSFYKERPLGGLGDFGTFSFHETKNISSGEGGLLIINDQNAVERAEIIREKGTNRSAFFRGETDKYGWVDVGSSFLPSDILAAFLKGQLERTEEIQTRRKQIWKHYWNRLITAAPPTGALLPVIPNWASNNAHMFYLVCRDVKHRTTVIEYMRSKGIQATFHYQSLHKSAYFMNNSDGRVLPNCDRFADCLMRLPLYFDMTDDEVDQVSDATITGLSL
jgi:dTDP-4-amino-4,6-dideoxygalactose transaminase